MSHQEEKPGGDPLRLYDILIRSTQRDKNVCQDETFLVGVSNMLSSDNGVGH